MTAPAAEPALTPDAIADRLRAAGCVFAEDEARLLIESAPKPGDLRAMIERRVTGVPLEQVIGWAEFCGLRVRVDAGVFVPRRRSELLVRMAADRASPGSVVVDLACGTGAIGAAIAARSGPIDLHACDVEAAAVRCARANLGPIGAHVYQGDLYAALPVSLRGRVAVIAANLPYVPTEAVAFMPAEARMYEPVVALDGGHDGLDLLRRAADEAAAWLAEGGHLLAETSSGQASAALDALGAAGLSAEVASDAGLGATVVIGRR